MGNKWDSEDGKNLLFSIILYPDMIAPEDLFLISMALSLGICDFLREFIKECSINGVAEIHNPQLYATWLDNEPFEQAVAHSDTPERTAVKRLLIEFEATSHAWFGTMTSRTRSRT